MKDEHKAFIAALIAVAICFSLIGYAAGNDEHEGKVLVPAGTGVPADLPYWACTEIVGLRMDNMDLEEIIRGFAYSGRRYHPPGVVHYRSYDAACIPEVQR